MNKIENTSLLEKQIKECLTGIAFYKKHPKMDRQVNSFYTESKLLKKKLSSLRKRLTEI